MSLLNRIEILRRNLTIIEPYASNCTGFRKLMPCRAFFPGGEGTWNRGTTGKEIKVLFLGSDFNNEANYYRELEKPEALIQDSPATWGGLVRLIDAAKISKEECFFTNAWPCLRIGSAKNSGDPPGAKDIAFTLRCLKFFLLTLREIEPEYVIMLGTWPTQFVSNLDPIAMKHWRVANWSKIDVQDHVIVTIENRAVTFIPAIHPCLPNHRYRSLHKTSALEAAHIRSVMNMDKVP